MMLVKMKAVFAFCILGCMFFLQVSDLHAGIIIHGTRIIYPANKKDVSLRTENKDDVPSLVQVWVDDGDLNVTAQNSKSPFIVTPTVVRVEPKSGQVFRVIALPAIEEVAVKNKESLFYFNLLDVVPKPMADLDSDADAFSYMQLNVRTRIKIFYRPLNLKGNVADAAQSLNWSMKKDAEEVILKVENPSAFHVSFAKAGIEVDENVFDIKIEMIKPGEVQEIKLNNFDYSEVLKKERSINFQWINDGGGKMDLKKVLNIDK